MRFLFISSFTIKDKMILKESNEFQSINKFNNG